MKSWLTVLAGCVFGAGSQYLGSRSALPWLAEASLLSAPWLVLPFLVGWSERTAKRAIAVGCVATVAALIGYFVMTLSPFESIHLHGSIAPIIALARSESKVLVGAIFTSPLYAYLGYRWRRERAWLSAALVGGALCFEPLALALTGRLPNYSQVWLSELTLGVMASLYFVGSGVLFRKRRTNQFVTS
jgi:hypothetical protein